MTLLFIIVFVSILILVHEAGHFYAARVLGVHVEEFGFGFPPRIFSRVKNGVRYSVNALPLGGFVRIFGERGEGEGEGDSFAHRPARQRLAILAAGVAMNALLAWLLFTVGAAIGIPEAADDAARDIPVSVIGVAPHSPAEQAGLRVGDQILEMRAADLSLRIESQQDIRRFVEAYRGEEVALVVQRNKEIREIRATPRVAFPEEEGPLGIALERLRIRHIPWYRAPGEGLWMLAQTTGAMLAALAALLWQLIARQGPQIAVSGPVGIFFFARDMQALGLSYFLQFIGILSINLAIINTLPIPALDGGRILFLAIEKIKGSRVNPRVENIVHIVGFALLLLLMAIVTYRDVAKIW